MRGKEEQGPPGAREREAQVERYYPKIINKSHGLRGLQAKLTLSDIHMARGEVSIDAENYLLAVKEVVAPLGMKRTGPEDSRSLAKALY